LECRLRLDSVAAGDDRATAIRNLKSQSTVSNDNLNRQSTISIVNRHSKNPQSPIGNPQSIRL
jgi:hypothetical protein